MCVYCEINRGNLIAVSLPRYNRKDIDEHAYIYYNNLNEPISDLYILNETLFADNSNGEFPHHCIPINYCPFCGRALREYPYDLIKDIRMMDDNACNYLPQLSITLAEEKVRG